MSTIGPVILAPDDLAFLEMLRTHLRDRHRMAAEPTCTQATRARSGLPKHSWGFALTVYQPGHQRLMVVRAEAVPGPLKIAKSRSVFRDRDWLPSRCLPKTTHACFMNGDVSKIHIPEIAGRCVLR
jgi:hypothetical protein